MKSSSADRSVESASVKPDGETTGDPTIANTFEDVRAKAEEVKLNKDGTPRKKTRKRSLDESIPGSGVSLGAPGFTEEQIKKAFQGVHSMAALATNCNVWFLSDDEANCFVPSATSALNQTFPQIAQSKWGAISLACLCYSGVLIAKTLVYYEYKKEQALIRGAKDVNPEPSRNGE